MVVVLMIILLGGVRLFVLPLFKVLLVSIWLI